MRYLVLFACLLLIACDFSPATTPTPVPPVTWDGTGNTDTARAALPAGDYLIRWQTRPVTPGCPLVGFLIRAGDATHAQQFGSSAAGQTRFNGLAAGSYYASIAAGECGWTVAVEPAP
jgi:hypothetical protein